MSPAEAVKLIKDGDMVGVGGFIGMCHPQELSIAIEDSFLETGHPRDLGIVFSAGIGDGTDQHGMNHLGHEGLLRRVVAGHWNLIPKIQRLVLDNKAEGYNLPLGTISQLFREIAGNRPGVITKIGLKTFVDPRLEGAKMNDRTREAEDLVTLMEIDGEEWLRYKSFPVDVAILRGTYADEDGNISMDREAAVLDNLAIAEAAKNCGGKVIVQVEKVVKNGQLKAKDVVIPGILVDAVIIGKPENHWQTYQAHYKPEFSGEAQIPTSAIDPMPLNARKIISRRAAMELKDDAVLNLGIGMPEGIANVANEEGLPGLQMTVEAGGIGGVPNSGTAFGSVTNPAAIIDEPAMFDFYDGGGLDEAFLGLAECDEFGNINVSRFGPRIAGCGGFINITQTAPIVVFCGTFTAKGVKQHCEDGKLVIDQEGQVKKFKKSVEQITFASEYAKQTGQKVLYITERAVFELRDGVFTLVEIAPGMDLQKDILDQMEFTPAIAEDLKEMDSRLFKEEVMGLLEDRKKAAAA
jgi:propionate CoA-transferase